MTRIMRGLACMAIQFTALAITLAIVFGPLFLWRALDDDARVFLLYLPIIALFAWLIGADE